MIVKIIDWVIDVNFIYKIGEIHCLPHGLRGWQFLIYPYNNIEPITISFGHMDGWEMTRKYLKNNEQKLRLEIEEGYPYLFKLLSEKRDKLIKVWIEENGNKFIEI